MKIKCDFCDAIDTGTQSQLQDKGWSKCIVFAPVKRTIITCPLHYDNFNAEIAKITKRSKDKR